MILKQSPVRATLDEIICGCRLESQQPRADEVGYCFALFERAIDEGDEAAWAALQGQYQRLIFDWLYTAARGSLNQTEVEDLVQEVWAKFWRTLSRRPQPLADSFDHAGALLRYLNCCAISTFLDYQQGIQRRRQVEEQLTGQAGQRLLARPRETAVERLHQSEQLERVLDWIGRHVTDCRERLILQLSYGYDLAPVEIAARHPDQFTSARQVRQIKDRILKRARRALLQ